MLLPADQRRLLGAFLRRHREALAPAAAGLPATPRRRTPGLRREEVAQLCGISTTWYSWVEQGRDIALSAGALARLAEALRLSAAERAYLFELARRRDPAPPAAGPPPDAAPPELLEALRIMAAPCYLLDRHWRARGCNDGAARLFAPWLDSGEPCLLRWVFLDPAARAFICDWPDRARRLLAEFRADTAHHPDDPGLRQLVEDLRRASPAFAGFWNDHAVLAREGGARSFNHPQDGVLRYEQVTFIPAALPDHKLVVLLPGR
ncbi:Helix-turn-helix domain-containing protein [Rhodovastum atsumiense]|uniref:Helix-turn-helix domain-containing protein n=1 Tax=Rhodovastum atsumiense TaxID=504468 RepID=A0A5M6J0Z3_9PROT|nr:helix-turn-helix transcriptional regulator [Rhodovastum atsumiense]KAA5613869.1 helix-turn-helix domain-containing protein [Rhodovastum atsumiense]CAH2601991.1 Helix-turn-helix domain-containing protein [Rhodovastum atsumiense]